MAVRFRAKDGSWKIGFEKTRARRLCFSFHEHILEDVWVLAAFSKDNMGTLALQTETCKEWLTYLHEYLAIRATSPSLAWVGNQRINEFNKHEADRCQECNLWLRVQTSAFQPIAAKFLMLANLANALLVAMQQGKGKDKLDQWTLLLKVVRLLVDMDRRLGALEDPASFAVVVHDEACKNKVRQEREL